MSAVLSSSSGGSGSGQFTLTILRPFWQNDRQRSGRLRTCGSAQPLPAEGDPGGLLDRGDLEGLPFPDQVADRGEGMQMMDQHILELLKAGKIAPEEALRCAAGKRTYEPLLPRQNSGR